MKNGEQGRFADPASYISTIHVEADCVDHPVTKKILVEPLNNAKNAGMETA